MPTRTRKRLKSSHQVDGYKYEELERAEFMNMTLLCYQVADGDPDDPASFVEKRCAIFLTENMPDNPYKHKSSYYGPDGLEGSLQDFEVEVVQEADLDYEAMRNDEENLLKAAKKAAEGQYGYTGQVTLPEFSAAVEAYSANENDEEAWAIITKWRGRQLRHPEER